MTQSQNRREQLQLIGRVRTNSRSHGGELSTAVSLRIGRSAETPLTAHNPEPFGFPRRLTVLGLSHLPFTLGTRLRAVRRPTASTPEISARVECSSLHLVFLGGGCRSPGGVFGFIAIILLHTRGRRVVWYGKQMGALPATTSGECSPATPMLSICAVSGGLTPPTAHPSRSLVPTAPISQPDQPSNAVRRRYLYSGLSVGRSSVFRFRGRRTIQDVGEAPTSTIAPYPALLSSTCPSSPRASARPPRGPSIVCIASRNRSPRPLPRLDAQRPVTPAKPATRSSRPRSLSMQLCGRLTRAMPPALRCPGPLGPPGPGQQRFSSTGPRSGGRTGPSRLSLPTFSWGLCVRRCNSNVCGCFPGTRLGAQVGTPPRPRPSSCGTTSAAGSPRQRDLAAPSAVPGPRDGPRAPGHRNAGRRRAAEPAPAFKRRTRIRSPQCAAPLNPIRAVDRSQPSPSSSFISRALVASQESCAP